MLKLGLAGLGIHGSRYANHLLAGEIPGATLAAVSRQDRNAGASFARDHGLAYAEDPRELAGMPGIDGVILVLPPDLHPAAAAACLDAGRPVLVEKPLAADARSAAGLAERVEKTGTPLMVSHTLRFDPVVRAIRDELKAIGALRLVAISQRFEPTVRGWIDVPGRGGAILNTGVHGFDLFRFLTGAEPRSVIAETASVVTRVTEDEFACVVRLEPGGILATLDNARTTLGRSARIEVAGERGQVRGDHIHRWLHRIEGRTETDLGPIPPGVTVPEALKSFVEVIASGSEPPVTARDGLAAVEMAEACALSARLGRRVDLDDLRNGSLTV
jgi:predicted dehydrogenase